MRKCRTWPTLTGMDIEHEADRGEDYDQDTVGDNDENTLDGSEGLDADVITTDGEDLTIDPPENWKPVEENHNLDEKLDAERPDVGEGSPTAGSVHTVDTGDGEVRTDEIDALDPEGRNRVLGED